MEKIYNSFSVRAILSAFVLCLGAFGLNAQIGPTGGTFTTCSATFQDPGGAGNYANSTNITYTIQPVTPATQRTTVTFTAFNVENNFDFFRVYDGTSAAAPLLTTYTGLQTGTFVITASAGNTSGALTFVFTSDAIVTQIGWDATVSCTAVADAPTTNLVGAGTATACGVRLFDSGGSGDYAANVSTVQTVNPTSATQLIRVAFSQFNTEAGFDFVTIYDGNSTAAPVLFGPTAGTTIPAVFTATPGNPSGALTFRFTSDASVQRAGYMAQTTCVARPVCNLVLPTPGILANTPGTCGRVITGTALDATTNGTDCNTATLTNNFNNSPSLNGVTLPVGATVIRWSITTLGGSVISGNVTYIVQDTEKPTFTSCPASPIVVNLLGGECSSVQNFNVSAIDNCGNNPIVQRAITQNDLDLTGPSVICGNGLALDYMRTYTNTFGEDLKITSIDAGVQASPAGKTLIASVYRRTGALLNANLTLISSGTVTLPAAIAGGALVRINLASTAVVTAGQQYVVAVTYPDDACIAGFSPNAETSPSYVRGCNLAILVQPTPVANFFGGRTWSARVNGVTGNLTVTQTSALGSGSTFPLGVTLVSYLATDAAGNTAVCSFNVDVREFANPVTSLTCNDLVYVSLDASCVYVLGADQVLEGGPYRCYSKYVVEVDRTLPLGNGPWEPAVLGPSDVGKTWAVRVTDPVTGNKCWGNVKIEDKLAPVLACTPVTIPCNANDAPGSPYIGTLSFATGNFPLPDGATVNRNVVVSGLGASTTKLRVLFTSNHTWVGDVTLRVTNPSGTSVTIFDRPGNPATALGCDGDGLNLQFDDAAATSYAVFETTCGNNPAISGKFQPSSPIAPLLTGNLNGTWTVTAIDPGFGDAATQDLATLEFTTVLNIPFPNNITNAIPNGANSYIVPAGSGTPVMENCSSVTLTYVDSEVQQSCASGLTKIKTRKWTAKDASGNTSTCNQIISFDRPTFDDLTLPPDYDGINAPFFNCGSQYPTPEYINGLGLQGTPFIFGKPEGCNITYTSNDVVLHVCDGTYKIRRLWTIVDWCLGTTFDYSQLIKVVDEVGPELPQLPDITISTDPFACCAYVNLPDVIVEDACSRIHSVSGMVTTFSQYSPFPQTGMTTFGGTLTSFPGNNLWDRDTLANFGNTTCLPLGRHTVTYIVEDDCGNTTSKTFRLTVQDLVPPTASCTQFTTIAIGVDDPFDCYQPSANGCEFAGVTWVPAKNFDQGSKDNCNDIHFTIQRMSPYSPCINGLNTVNGHPDCADVFQDPVSEFDLATLESDSIKFYCCEVGTTQTVILRVYQLDADGQIAFGPDGPIVNSCMINVEVQDKIKPVCIPPAPVTVWCENFDNSLWSYGKASIYDNCCLDSTKVYQGQKGLTHSVSYSQFDTVCNKGTITRTFRAFDCHGFSSQCQQKIVVNYRQDYYVKFPNDLNVTVCNGAPNQFGEPTFYGENCELLGVSYVDELFTVVPDACYKIERTWKIINWCTYNPNLPCINVPNPVNNTGPTVSASTSFPAPLGPTWNATVTTVVTNPAVPNGSSFNYSTIWNADANCYVYKQIIKVVDTQDPVVQCPASPQVFCDLTPNNPQLWNEPSWYDNTISSHDLCEGPADLTLTGTDACSGANITFRYLLFLDLDGDGVMETVVNSANLPGYNNIQYNNAANANYAGGVSRAFDERNVAFNQKYGFALETKVSGANRTANVRWNTIQSPGTYVVPELPYGTHKIKWFVEDGCGNETVCEYTFVVKDCKKPTVVCLNGLSVNIMPTQMIQLWATDFLQYAEDNCTPAGQLKIGIIRSELSTGVFPTNADGTPQTNVVFTCADLGTRPVQLWAIDAAGNADFCETYVIVQDNNHNCGIQQKASIAGALKTEASNGLQDAEVDLQGTANGIPPISMFGSSTQSGNYMFSNAIPMAGNATVTPTEDANHINGVSTFDLVLISKHILGIEPLTSPYKMIAADANNSKSITTFDIVELRKLVLGIYTELPNNTSWRFVDKSYTFPNAANPWQAVFPENKTIANIQASEMNDDFVAVKVGDLNGNAVANTLMATEDRTTGTLLFDVQDRAVKAGETFEVSFKAAEQVTGYQFTMNHAGLEVVDVVPGANMTMDNFGVLKAENAITTSFDGKSVGEFTVRFRATQSGELNKMLVVSSRITRAEAYSAGNDKLEVAFRFNGANGATVTGVGFELYQNQPNPFVDKTFVGFHLPEAAQATLTVYDETGRTLFTQQGDFAKGYNQIAIDRALLNTTGMLYYKVATATDAATRKMIQTK